MIPSAPAAAQARQYDKIFTLNWRLPEGFGDEQFQDILRRTRLDERERQFIDRRVDGATFAALAEEFSVSTERARQITARAIRKFQSSRLSTEHSDRTDPLDPDYMSGGFDGKLRISLRAASSLQAAGVRSIDDLCKMKESDLSIKPGIGVTTVEEVKKGLQGLSLKLDMSEDERRAWKAQKARDYLMNMGPLLPLGRKPS